MIEKHTILITSTGRTGTEFFARLLADIIPGCTSLHEPDIVKFPGVENRLQVYAGQLRRAGLWRMLLLKGLGQWTLASLSDARFSGTLEDAEATALVERQRAAFVTRMPGSLYVESNLGFYGLLDLTPRVFQNHRAIYLVRDGRDWVRSMMNWGEVYGKTGPRRLLAHKWPTARDLPEDPLSGCWDELPRFNKLCWAWARLNEFGLGHLSRNPDARLFRFEEIFAGEERYAHLDELLAFATSMPGLEEGARPRSAEGWLERKIHQSADGFPGWEGWTAQQRQHFEETCGPLMQRLGYEF